MSTVPADPAESELIARLASARERLLEELSKTIVGQRTALEQVILAVLCRGHVLLEGVPGLAKTVLVQSLGRCLDCSSGRVSFTPDLVPSDITGADIIQEDPETGRRQFEFLPGPIFANLVLADEINRCPPKTQAALLEAMQERRVTVRGRGYELPDPFVVLATQNPIEQEGTYPLPEAQLDRFLLEVTVTYPELAAERQMLIATTGAAEAPPEPALTADELLAAQALIRRVPVGESVVEAILSIVRGGRPEISDDQEVRKHVAWGPGPRAAQALMLASRARALLDGRLAPSVEDVIALAPPVLRHRMALNFSARADGIVLSDIISRLIGRLG